MSWRFCLVDQPWLPCLGADGHVSELGLAEALRSAQGIVEVIDPSPLVTIALHRLLLAVLYRALYPLNEAGWAALWRHGAWPDDRLLAYLETWSSRFDLFHEEHPFYQVPGLPERHLAPVSRLSQHLASGARATLFDHTLDGSAAAVSAAAAARLAVAYQCFCLSGRVGGEQGLATVRSGPLAHAAVFLPTGRNLFETLMLNLLPDGVGPASGSDGIPAWERTEATAHAPRLPQGYPDLLSWQSRRLWLEPAAGADGTAEVARVVVCGGWEAPGDCLVPDPMLAYRRRAWTRVPAAGWAALRLPKLGAWWHLRAALLSRSQPELMPPATLLWIAELVACGVLEPDYDCGLSVFGLRAEKARIDAWGHHRQRLPVRYLEDPDLAADLERCLEVAEETSAALRHALNTTDVGGQPDWDRAYWSRLQGDLPVLLDNLPGDLHHRDATLLWWVETCAQRAWQVLRATTARQPLEARALPQLVRARRDLASGLHRRALRPYRGGDASETVGT